jgi:hypothetical protein
MQTPPPTPLVMGDESPEELDNLSKQHRAAATRFRRVALALVCAVAVALNAIPAATAIGTGVDASTLPQLIGNALCSVVLIAEHFRSPNVKAGEHGAQAAVAETGARMLRARAGLQTHGGARPAL